MITKNNYKIIIGSILVIAGFFLLYLSFSKGDLTLFLTSIIVIPFGFLFTLSSINKNISYITMGVIDGISSPLSVYVSIHLWNYNHVNMGIFIFSLLLGLIGVIIAIIGVMIELDIIRFKKSNAFFYYMLSSQIILWPFSILLGILSAEMVYIY